MSVYEEPGRGWRYDFWFRGQRYRATRALPNERKARAAEDAERKRLQEIADGAKLDTENSPLIQEWAETYTDEAIKGGDISEDSTVLFDIRVVLRFFGVRPEKPHRGDPYHNLTLADVVRDDNWIIQFEEWIDRRGVAGSTKNKYRSVMSKMFKLAMEPRFRRLTGIVRNPFAEVRRDPPVRRYTTFDGAANLTAVRSASPPHLQLAIDIALYALKFRRGSILDLEWSKSRTSTAWVDDKMEYLITEGHKTRRHSGLRQVAVIAPRLKKILIAAKKRQDAINKRLSKRYGRKYSACNHVVQWHGLPIKDPKKSFRAACERAGVRYGLHGGVTFHSLRHEQGTEAARQGIDDAMRQSVFDHSTNSASQIYKHLVPEHEREAVFAMAKATERKLARGARELRGDLRGDLSGRQGKTHRNTLKVVSAR